MSEFNLSSVNLNGESKILDANQNNDNKISQPELVDKSKSEPELESEAEPEFELDSDNNVKVIEVDEEFYKRQEEYHKKYCGIHFTCKSNIIEFHKDVNTNIIMKEHHEKLVFFCNFTENFETSEVMTDGSDEFTNYKINNFTNNPDDNNCESEEYEYIEDSCYFIASNIYSDDKKIIVEGTVGYSYDPRDIKLIYDLELNQIYIGSYYRFVHDPIEGELFYDKYEITNGKVVIDVKKDNTTDLVTILNDSCKLHEKEHDGLPYYRYPRSKDGIVIPRVVYNVFKVFQDPNVPHPKIIIPSEFYVYEDTKYTSLP